MWRASGTIGAAAHEQNGHLCTVGLLKRIVSRCYTVEGEIERPRKLVGRTHIDVGDSLRADVCVNFGAILFHCGPTAFINFKQQQTPKVMNIIEPQLQHY